MKKINIDTLKNYVVFFYIYAFFGWIIDVSIVLFSDHHFENRGFLLETICPMYGFAALVLILLSKKLKGNGKFFKRVAIATIWCSVLEYVTAVILEVFLHKPCWDYSAQPLNFQGRVCLAASLLWGVISIVFMEYIHPFIEKVYSKTFVKIPKYLQNIIILFFLICTLTDTVYSVTKCFI